jgi:hypothetical protein
MTENNKYWGLGVITGVVLTSLIAIAMSKITATPEPVPMPQTVIDAYNMGIKDALRTNPASSDLEDACLALWAKKQ